MIEVLGHSSCSACKQAINALASHGKGFTYLDAHDPVNVGLVDSLRRDNISTVPQIWVDNTRIGGLQELNQYLINGGK